MNSVKIVFSSNPVLDKLRPRIENALNEVLSEAISAINATDVEIVIDIDSQQTIPETGLGGSTETPHKILVFINPEHKNVQKNLEQEIKSTVVHELHHAMRNRLYPWPGTLLDDIVGEGLADYFDIEINGQRPKPWSKALSDEELIKYQRRAEEHFFEQNTEEDYFKWVLGSEVDGIPQWAGYALGFKLVGNYLAKTGKKASELVAIESSEFIK